MLWGGRFKKNLDKNALKFSSSLKFDINLILEDIEGSIAHAEMLFSINILSKNEKEKIISGLAQIKNEWLDEKWTPDENIFEDIHSAVEARLFELIGETAGKLHTGRSRNDQVATDIKLWLKKVANELTNSAKNLQKVLINISKENIDTIIPGYTHLQRAQPISLAFHLLAYVEMLERDKKRLKYFQEFLNESPLGSGALAGSTLPLDRDETAKKLGFQSPTANALDSVSDRDHLIDYLNICSIGMMHLSRLCEEIIIWSSSEWNFIKLLDEFTTGSSLMPQKKNPDLAELIRGKSGRVFGNYISLITTLKGMPLSYNRDLQEDKEPLFDSHFSYRNSLDIISDMLASAEFNKERFIEELKGDFSLATDLADWLVLKGIPFRKAHELIGKIVSKLESEQKNFSDADLHFLKEIDDIFDETALECLMIESSLERKKTIGSPNPKFVAEQIKKWEKDFDK
jgi:argininosuccinate lyase